MSLTVSPDQRSAIQGICATLLNPSLGSHAIAILTGSAGTGKTTTVIEIIEEARMRLPTSDVYLTATTNRAADVLGNITNAHVTTAHKLFGLRPSVTAYGKEILKRTGTMTIPDNSLVIIDEASMLGNQFLRAIVDEVRARALKVLFVGDPYQLPPPADKCSLFDGTLPTFTLTKVHRQALNNPILNVATQYRDYIKGDRSNPPGLKTLLDVEGNGIHVLSHKDFISQFVKKYLHYNAGDEIDVPMCTYTNDSAINYNNMIRKASFFLEGTIAPFHAGERLISNSAVSNQSITILRNNEIVYVNSYTPTEFEGIPGYTVNVTSELSRKLKRPLPKAVFVPQTKAMADKVLKEIKNNILNKGGKTWQDYYDLKNCLADLRPPFAGTTHKAQGGTFSAIFIDKTNIDKCRNPMVKARLMYVALTRATTNAYINS